MKIVQPTTAENLTEMTKEEIMRKNKEMTEEFMRKWKEEKENPTSKSFLMGIREDLKNLSVRDIFNFSLPVKGFALFFILFACGNFLWNQAFWSVISIIEAVATIMIFIIIPSVRNLASQLDPPEKVAKVMGIMPVMVREKTQKKNPLKKYFQFFPLWRISIQSREKQRQVA